MSFYKVYLPQHCNISVRFLKSIVIKDKIFLPFFIPYYNAVYFLFQKKYTLFFLSFLLSFFVIHFSHVFDNYYGQFTWLSLFFLLFLCYLMNGLIIMIYENYLKKCNFSLFTVVFANNKHDAVKKAYKEYQKKQPLPL